MKRDRKKRKMIDAIHHSLSQKNGIKMELFNITEINVSRRYQSLFVSVHNLTVFVVQRKQITSIKYITKTNISQ